jgi:hypothetical protein
MARIAIDLRAEASIARCALSTDTAIGNRSNADLMAAGASARPTDRRELVRKQSIPARRAPRVG